MEPQVVEDGRGGEIGGDDEVAGYLLLGVSLRNSYSQRPSIA